MMSLGYRGHQPITRRARRHRLFHLTHVLSPCGRLRCHRLLHRLMRAVGKRAHLLHLVYARIALVPDLLCELLLELAAHL
eukprot:2918744-Pleurochrysis_carterae.AAC.1